MPTRPLLTALAATLIVLSPLSPLHGNAVAAEEHLDGIAAVVGDEVILLSEIEAYLLSRLNEAKTRPDSAGMLLLRRQFLEELIDGKVLLAHAKKDTTIVVRNEDVESAMTNYLNRTMQENSWDEERLAQELAKQGLTPVKFKTQLRKSLREQLMKQRVQQSYLSTMTVTKKDVQSFYARYKDSLPRFGQSVRLLKLVMAVTPTDSVRQAAFTRITTIKNRLNAGEAFPELAKKFSDDPMAASGGDLGFISKGTLNELAFEEKAFSLQPGQVSDPFETRLGFHIVSVMARKNQMVHVAQIFVKITAPPAALGAAKMRLDSVRTSCTTPECFGAATRRLCTDPQLASRGGDAGWTTVASLPQNVRDSFDTLAQGATGKIIESDNTFTLYMITRLVPEREPTLEDDWDALAEKAKDITAQKKIIDLVKKWRKDVLVDIRL